MENSTKKHQYVHECQMPISEDIIVRYIDSGLFVNLRRKIRRALVVSDTNPRSKDNLKSSASIRHEKLHHLQHYYYMIHPFSDGRAYYEFFMMFVFFALLILIPIEISTNSSIWIIKIPKFILDLLCLMDIGITFATGYYNINTKKVIMDPGKVAKNYLLTYFFVDLISSVPIDLVLSMASSSTKNYWFVKLLTYIKVLRIMTITKYLSRFRDWQQYKIYKFKVFEIVTFYLLALLWCTSLTYLIASSEEERQHPFIGLLKSAYSVVLNILLVGHSFKGTKVVVDLVFTMVTLTMGIMLQLIIFAQILQLLNKYNSSSNKYRQLLQQITEYTRYKELPDVTRRRICRYFEFRFQKNYYKEQDILSTISGQLRQEIVLHSCKRLVESVNFFRELPTALILRIVTAMKSEIFLAKDVIVYAGTEGDCMYFIASGTVAVYTSTGIEICHLTDGSHFGEIALVMDTELRVANVVAVDSCELFSLSRKDFQKAIEPYPDMSYRIRKLAINRLQKTMRVMEEDEGEKELHSNRSMSRPASRNVSRSQFSSTDNKNKHHV